MRRVSGAETTIDEHARASRRTHDATVYRRRRVVAACVALVGLWLSVSGCQAALGWFASGEASAGTPDPGAADSNGDDATAAAEAEPACPVRDDELFARPTTEVPADLAAEISELVAHDEITQRDVSISVWVDGWGEIVALDPDEALKPASNQKILTAIGALELLDPASTLTTEIRSTAPIDADGRINGDLIIVGGGDPVLWDAGAHSIYQLAADLYTAGVREVTGVVYVDESRYDERRMAQGWTDDQIPGDAAPISAFTVAANRLGDTPEYLADPQLGNAEVFVSYLGEVGIQVWGGVLAGEPSIPTSDATVLVSTESPTISDLVHQMLKNSDNTTAELLLKEVGLQASGEPTTLGGLAAARAVVDSWCVTVEGTDDDGSGLSYRNARSAREWRRILQAAQDQTWWPEFHDGLPVAGEGGTMGSRLSGEATAGNLRAKTGTIDVAKTLSGTFTTAGGRQATFSVIINDDTANPSPAMGPTDLILEAIASHPG